MKQFFFRNTHVSIFWLIFSIKIARKTQIYTYKFESSPHQKINLNNFKISINFSFFIIYHIFISLVLPLCSCCCMIDNHVKLRNRSIEQALHQTLKILYFLHLLFIYRNWIDIIKMIIKSFNISSNYRLILFLIIFVS